MQTVRWINSCFLKHGRSGTEIAAELNERGILNDLDRVWTRATVHQILTNEKYIGNNVYNRRSFKLRDAGTQTACSNLYSHSKIDLPTAQLAAAGAVLVKLPLIRGRRMSTRAQIAVLIGPKKRVQVHCDGYTPTCCPRWKPAEIVAASEIRQVTPEALDCVSPP